MSGFLTRATNEEEVDEGRSNEELYEKLFPKIGRDFVYKADFVRMMQLMMSIIDPLGVSPIDLTGDTDARKKALEYKLLLKSGRDGSSLYKDLINLED